MTRDDNEYDWWCGSSAIEWKSDNTNYVDMDMVDILYGWTYVQENLMVRDNKRRDVITDLSLFSTRLDSQMKHPHYAYLYACLCIMLLLPN